MITVLLLVLAAPVTEAEVYVAREKMPPAVARLTLPAKATPRIRTQTASSPMSAALTKALLGKGETLLKTHDLDEDECVTPLELVENLTSVPAAGKRERLTATTDAAEVFAHYDRDDRGHLLRGDIALSPALFAKADADGDGKLSPAEFAAYLKCVPRADADLTAKERVVRSSNSATIDIGRMPGDVGTFTLFVAGGSRGAFEWLDADRDGKLSRAELRVAKKRLPADAKPADLTMTLLPGDVLSYGVRLRRGADVVRPGPDWFRAMDRNDDGHVSRAEWPGDDKTFAQLDRDRDDLISPVEAAASDATKEPRR